MSWAKVEFDNAFKQLPKGTNLSLLVQTVESKPKTIVEYNASLLKTPASVEKLITAVAALLELGPNYRFKTEMLTNGVIKNKQLYGNLRFKMSGDPTFTTQQLSDMVKQLKAKGVDKIPGDILIDTSVFAGHDNASGWSWDNLTACYNTSPSATIINGNCFYVDVITQPTPGEKAQVKIKSTYPIIVDIDVKTIAQTHKEGSAIHDKYCDFNMVYKTQNHYELNGCLAYRKDPLTLKFAIQDSVDYFSSILKEQLKQQGITFQGQIIEHKTAPPGKWTVLATAQSAPLTTLLNTMLKQSHNLIADTLFRTIGAHYYKTSGTWRNASDAVKSILKEQAKVDLSYAVIADGSGLSRLNQIDATQIMTLLQYIAAHDKQLNLIAMLPTSGKDGTLLYRKSVNDPSLKHNVSAKTGHLNGVYNMAGFITGANNRRYAFVQFVSGYNETKATTQNSALTRFETTLYKSIASQ